MAEDTPRVFIWPEPERFIALVIKARSEGVTLSPIPRFTKLNVATSGTDTSRRYLVDEFACSCQAGKHGNLCKHKCLYIFEHLTRIKTEHGLPDWKLSGAKILAA